MPRTGRPSQEPSDLPLRPTMRRPRSKSEGRRIGTASVASRNETSAEKLSRLAPFRPSSFLNHDGIMKANTLALAALLASTALPPFALASGADASDATEAAKPFILAQAAPGAAPEGEEPGQPRPRRPPGAGQGAPGGAGPAAPGPRGEQGNRPR